VRADIFKLHSLIMDDYKSYIQSFININDPEIRKVVENELSKGKLWPEPVGLEFAIKPLEAGQVRGNVIPSGNNPDRLV
jgi:hypothetical protein